MLPVSDWSIHYGVDVLSRPCALNRAHDRHLHLRHRLLLGSQRDPRLLNRLIQRSLFCPCPRGGNSAEKRTFAAKARNCSFLITVADFPSQPRLLCMSANQRKRSSPSLPRTSSRTWASIGLRASFSLTLPLIHTTFFDTKARKLRNVSPWAAAHFYEDEEAPH